MGALLVQVGSVLSTFLGVALVVFGSYSAYSGAITVEQAAAFGVVAVAVVGGYRSLVSGSGARVDAASNAALFVLGAGAYVGGVVGGVGTAATVGQALLAIAVAYLVVRLV